jgi:hypothetical protein
MKTSDRPVLDFVLKSECPKCLGEVVNITYMDSDFDGEEFLHVQCTKCKYFWYMYTADHKEEVVQ